MDFKKYRDGMIEGISLRDRIIRGINVHYIRVDDCEDLDPLEKILDGYERVMFFLLYNDLVSFIHGSLSKGESLVYNEKGYVELLMPYDKLFEIIKSIKHFVNTNKLALYENLQYCEGLIEGLENVNTCRELKFEINEDEDHPFGPADLKILVGRELVADILKYRDDDFADLAIKVTVDESIYEKMSLNDRLKSGVPVHANLIENMYIHEYILEFLHGRFINDLYWNQDIVLDHYKVLDYKVSLLAEIIRDYISSRDKSNYYIVRDYEKFLNIVSHELNAILATVPGVSYLIEGHTGAHEQNYIIKFTIDVEYYE